MSEKDVTLPVTGMTCADFALNIKRNVAEPLLGVLLQCSPGAVGSRCALPTLLRARLHQGHPSSHRCLGHGPLEMEVQGLQFPDHTFDTVFATFFFRSVPGPVCKMAVDPTEAPASFTQKD